MNWVMNRIKAQRAGYMPKSTARFIPSVILIRTGKYAYTRLEQRGNQVRIIRVTITPRQASLRPGQLSVQWLVKVHVFLGSGGVVHDQIYATEREAVEDLAAELSIDPDSVR